MTATVNTPPTKSSHPDPEERARARFEEATAEHELTVLKDDGLYRHLRFQKPGTSVYYYDLITWPGYLAITGDAGDYVFSRLSDMFEFFEGDGDRINPHYWSEKLRGGGYDSARRYDANSVRTHVLQWFEDMASDMDADEAQRLREALDLGILDRRESLENEHDAHRLLREFEFNHYRIHDSWEWDLREYDERFLWCCWAISRGINRYRQL
jgi:hypothetical protein